MLKKQLSSHRLIIAIFALTLISVGGILYTVIATSEEVTEPPSTTSKLKQTATSPTATPAPEPTPAPDAKKPAQPKAFSSSQPVTSLADKRWRPRLDDQWQYQLTDTIDLTKKADVYDIDGFDTSAHTIADIHANGAKAVCYINAGAWEDWRPDAATFPSHIKGNDLDGWEGERWLDTRKISTLAPIISARMDMCVRKGFDGVEFDNVDGHIQDSGFTISYNDQLTYNKWLATTARSKGLAVGLKNTVDQIPQLVGYYDFAVNEECASWNECETLRPFIAAGKPVFHVEYEIAPSRFCPLTTKLGFSSIKKTYDLRAPVTRCP